MDKKSLNILYLIVFIDMLGFGVVIPFLPYLVGKLGASGFFATSLLSVYSLMQFVFSPLLGKLSDRYGRKPILLLCLLGSVVSYAIYASAFYLSKDSHITLTLIFISRLLAGVMGANIAVAYAYITDKTGVTARTSAMGKIGAAFGLGLIIGPAIATFLSPFGLAAPGYCAMAICAIGLIGACLLLKESKPLCNVSKESHHVSGAKRWSILSQQTIILLILISFVHGFAFVQMESIFSLYMGTNFHLSQAQIGWLFVYVGIVIAVSQGVLVGKLSKVIGDTNLLLVGTVLLALTFYLITIVNSMWLMIIITGGIALGAGAVNPALTALISNFADLQKQGEIQGINQSALSLARVLGPLAAGILYDIRSPNAPFLLGAILMFITTITIVFFKCRTSTSIKNKISPAMAEN